MTREIREGRAEGAPHRYSDEELAWMGEHLTQMRQSVSGQRLVLQSLGIGFVLGLAAYVGGYVLKASATTEPFQLVADLLYALGLALWTGWSRRGPVRRGHSEGQTASIQAGARCLRGGAE